jgi:uncharacterized protein YktA (UPF0223 family)
MKLLFSLIFSILINPGWSFVITDRVGEEIDFEEAKGYKLFQNVKGFKQARFEKIDIGKYELLIEREGDSLRIPLTASPILALKDYLENFENIVDSKDAKKAFEKRNNISTYDIFGIPITGEEVRAAKSASERIGCVLGGGSLGLFVGSLLGWSNAVEYVGQEHGHCLVSNIYQVNRPLFFTYSAAGFGIGGGIGYYSGSEWDSGRAKEQAKMRGFAYFNADTIISTQEVKRTLMSSQQPNPCLLIGIPISLLSGFAAMMLAYYTGRSIKGIDMLDQVIGEEVPSAIAITIGVGTTATLIDHFLKVGYARDRKATIERLKREKAKLLKE